LCMGTQKILMNESKQMSEAYNISLKDILCKVAQVDNHINDKVLKKIEEIYFKLTGNYFSKKKIFNQILESDNNKLIEVYLKKNIKSLGIFQKIDILHAAEEIIALDGMHRVKAEELIAKLKKLIFDFK